MGHSEKKRRASLLATLGWMIGYRRSTPKHGYARGMKAVDSHTPPADTFQPPVRRPSGLPRLHQEEAGQEAQPHLSPSQVEELQSLVDLLSDMLGSHMEQAGRGPMPEMEGYNRHDFDINVPTIHVKTGSFEADAIELYEMPHMQVLDLVTSRGPAQMLMMLDMFKLAVIDQNKVTDLEILTFNEITEIVGQWASKSTARWVELGLGGANQLGNGEDD